MHYSYCVGYHDGSISVYLDVRSCRGQPLFIDSTYRTIMPANNNNEGLLSLIIEYHVIKFPILC